MNLYYMLVKRIVKFTPTQKDDAILAKVEKFIEENPEVLDLFGRMLNKKLAEKDSKNP